MASFGYWASRSRQPTDLVATFDGKSRNSETPRIQLAKRHLHPKPWATPQEFYCSTDSCSISKSLISMYCGSLMTSCNNASSYSMCSLSPDHRARQIARSLRTISRRQPPDHRTWIEIGSYRLWVIQRSADSGPEYCLHSAIEMRRQSHEQRRSCARSRKLFVRRCARSWRGWQPSRRRHRGSPKRKTAQNVTVISRNLGIGYFH